jgi:hypothetical protein
MDDIDSNNYVNQLTLDFLISKSQLQKLNKLRQKEILFSDNVVYDKSRISKLFNDLLNNKEPDDLLDDVKSCFDALIEKSIYYLEIHDKNISIQNERNEDLADKNKDDIEDLVDKNDDFDKDDEDEYFEDIEDVEDFEDIEYFEEPEPEPVIRVNKKYSKKPFLENGVDDIHKLPLDWFNTTRQSYKINQIIPRKKEIIIDNKSLNNLADHKEKYKHSI